MEYFNDIIQTTINSFDFTYCVTVNVVTYSVIQLLTDVRKGKEVKTWTKRVILIVSILSTGLIYWALGKPLELLFNSAILAPVAWSWIFKPICNKLGIDYSQFANTTYNEDTKPTDTRTDDSDD